MTMRLHLSAQLPDDYRALFWHEFMTSRRRGISLATHFPWLLDPHSGALFLTMRDGERLLGGLTLLPRSSSLMALGLVCIDASCRGQGLGSCLLQAAMAEVDNRGHDATVLWTRQPAFYESLGFKGHDSSCRLTVDGWQRDSSTSVDVRPWPDGSKNTVPARGLPPFAVAAYRLGQAADGASVIVIQDAFGLQVVEHCGDVGLAQDMLRAWAPERWRMHATSADAPLVRALLAATPAAPGLSIALTPETLQMWRPHPARASQLTPPAPWGLLDRL